MDITGNKYIRFVFNELGKVPGRRYSSMIHRKVYQDTKMPRQDKERIETAIALLKINGYVEEKAGGTPVMNLVLATEDKGNKVIDYGKRVEITVDLLDWIPFDENRQNYGKLLYDLTGDEDSLFPASEQSINESIIDAGIQLPPSLNSRIDIYEYVMQQTEQPVYEKFLKSLSEKIENQGMVEDDSQGGYQSQSPAVTKINISNPIIIENMSASKIKQVDKSQTTTVTVTGNDNQVVTNSRNTQIDNTKSPKSKQHWLQILYWVVGIAVALIGIYKFFIE